MKESLIREYITNMDFRGEAFPSIAPLLPLARIENCYALCTYPKNWSRKLCGAPASMTQRLVNGQPASYNDQIFVVEKPNQQITYTARCLGHWELRDRPRREIARIPN